MPFSGSTKYKNRTDLVKRMPPEKKYYFHTTNNRCFLSVRFHYEKGRIKM